jgi:hypothetical protein
LAGKRGLPHHRVLTIREIDPFDAPELDGLSREIWPRG